MNIKMILSYDGTEFLGWQESIDGITIQETLRKALETIYQHPVQLEAGSRTDRGVHAEGQVACYTTQKPFNLTRLKYSLNQLLPKAIRVLKLEQALETFHPSLDAKGKEYHYSLSSARVQSPFIRYFSWHITSALDLDLMREGATFLIGTHDFTTFCNTTQPKEKNPICTLTRLDMTKEGTNFRFEIEGNRVLYKMVRNIIGTLVYLGMGRMCVDEIKQLLQKKDRTRAGMTAPAHGLILKKIYYI